MDASPKDNLSTSVEQTAHSKPLKSYRQINSLRGQLLNECDAMTRYILNNGIRTSSETLAELDRIKHQIGSSENEDRRLEELSGSDIKALSKIHQTLSKAAAPAIPRTLKLLADEQDKRVFLYFLGPVPLLRWLSLMSIFFLAAMILIGLSDRVNSDLINQGFLNSSNKDLFFNQMFLLCCAGLGAGFANLFQASRHVSHRIYDPQYDSTYWSRVVMGLMSGTILVELVPKELFTDNVTLKSFGKPALAMLGGFSASLVHRVLRRLVDTVESLFKADTDTSTLESQVKQAEQAEQKATNNIEVASRLIEIKSMMENGASNEEVQKTLNEYVKTKLNDTA